MQRRTQQLENDIDVDEGQIREHARVRLQGLVRREVL